MRRPLAIAFVGIAALTPQSLGVEFPDGRVVFDGSSALLTVTFDPPVPPGAYLRLEVAPVRNPQWDGTYLFAVTAFPRGGDRAMGQNIGTGRLQFYRNSDFF